MGDIGETRSTWGAVNRLLKRSTTFQQEINVAFDDAVPDTEKLSALQQLRKRLDEDPARQMIREKIGRESQGTWVDEFSIQISILSTRTFDWFTPVHSQHHILFIPLVCLVATYIFRLGIVPSLSCLICGNGCH